MLHKAMERKKGNTYISYDTEEISINFHAYANEICRLPCKFAKHVLVFINNLIHCEFPSGAVS